MGKVRLSSKSSELNYPTIRPTLDLNFAATKTLDPRITFTRSSTGTYVGSDGLIKTAGIDEPRFDHDPITGECRGLLIEESRSNTISWSFGRTLFTRGFGTVSSFTGSLVVGEIFTSSNGGTFRLIRYSGGIAHFIAVSGDQALGNLPLTASSGTIISFSSQNSTYNTTLSDSIGINYFPSPVVSPLQNTIDIASGYWTFNASKSANTACICSIYVKVCDTNVDKIYLNQQSGGDGDTTRTYTLSTNSFDSVSGSGAGNAIQGVQMLQNGWYRFYWGRTSMTGTAPRFTVIAQNSSGVQVNGGVYFDGGQVEEASFPTSYIPTSGSTVTRSADNATITGTNFTNWYNTNEGTLLTIGKPISSYIVSSSSALVLNSSSSSTNTISNILYYPKNIQYSTLKTMDAYSSSVISVITDGLVLNLDAGNTLSYSGSGDTWYDLSGNNVVGTLTNGPTYSSSNGGSIVFDGTNDFVSVPSGIPQRTSQFTNEIWVYPTSLVGGTNGYSTLIRMNGSRVGGGSGDFYFVLRDQGQVHCEIRNVADTSFDQYTTSTGIIQVNNWYHIVQVIDRINGNLKFYVNGVSRLDTSTSTFGIVTNSSIQIAQQGTDVNNLYARRLTGRVSNVKLYDRILTASEVQQNFNALRWRFGI